jgi:AGCS family alanine or glycine:cation symporter
MTLFNKRTFLYTLSLLIFTSSSLFSQEKGLDEKINEAFTPIANWWEGLILHHFFGTGIPTIIILLVGGALFFTVYFGFVNIRRFGTAINTVRGKYDSIDHHESGNPELAVEGDVVGTIADESKEGEVSHFQALATAVSGTVGNGNIAGVALAIAVGGPGATFWMIL